jgi:hypothetical protein
LTRLSSPFHTLLRLQGGDLGQRNDWLN